MENKQTAVEWLVNELKNNGLDYIDYAKETIDQAKAMEKEQIIKAAIVSHFEGVRQSAKTSKEYLEYGEQYYNETFKSE
jgi:hypothetical protein